MLTGTQGPEFPKSLRSSYVVLGTVENRICGKTSIILSTPQIRFVGCLFASFPAFSAIMNENQTSTNSAYRYIETVDQTESAIFVHRPFLDQFRTDDDKLMRRLWETHAFIRRGLQLSLNPTFKHVHHQIYEQLRNAIIIRPMSRRPS